MDFSKIGHTVLKFFKDKMPDYFKRTFDVSSTKVSKIIGFVIFAVSLLAVVLSVNSYISQEFAGKWFLFAFALSAPFIIWVYTALNFKIKSPRYDAIWHYVFFLLMPIVTMTMSECLNGIFVYNMTYGGFFGNYVVILVLYSVVFAIFGSLRVSYISVTSVIYLFALAHSYIMEFRGTPFIPMDFVSISTAAGVAGTYNYTPDYKIITASLIFIFIIVVGAKTKTPKSALLTRIILRSAAGTISAVLLLLYFGTNILTDIGIKPDFWSQSRGYKNYGFVYNYVLNTKYLYMSKPDNYNPEEISGYVSEVVESSGKEIDNSYQKPNIICIMNESLSDLQVLGNFTTNEDYMPFMRSLTKNTVKGNLFVPVIGAGTSNTEFEFLTGHSISFLPSGSNAYMLYVKNPLASIVSTLKAQGYSSMALHPYYAIGWRRTEVYKNFGFGNFISLEDIMDVSIMQEYQENGSDPDYLQSLIEQKYPGSNMLIRQYVSDSYNYKLLIEDYENRDKSVPYFAFNVTMQNHGGYTTSALNFDESIYTTSTKTAYIKTNKYLSLMKQSDNAFKELITYFSKVKEPTIICMFGDHQPSVEAEFIAEVMGVNSLSNITVEQDQSRYCTPFYIWANYDIEEKTVDRLSSNYLSSLVLQTAGVKLTEYNKYLLKLSETLPVIDTAGYIDNNGNYYKWSDASPYTELLDEYEKVQYNAIFDKENVNADIFYIDGFVPQSEEKSDEE